MWHAKSRIMLLCWSDGGLLLHTFPLKSLWAESEHEYEYCRKEMLLLHDQIVMFDFL